MNTELIKKYTNCINSICTASNKKNAITSGELKSIIGSHGINHNLTFFLARSGVLTHLDRGQYKCNYAFVEPVVAKRVIEEANSYWKKNTNKTKPTKKLNGSHVKDAKPIQKFAPPPVKSTTRKKSISFLWGVFKVEF